MRKNIDKNRRNRKRVKRCVIVINRLSGNGNRADENVLATALGAGYAVDFFHIVEKQKLEDFSQYDRIVVCGGDGTLNGILNQRWIKIRCEVGHFFVNIPHLKKHKCKACHCFALKH